MRGVVVKSQLGVLYVRDEDHNAGHTSQWQPCCALCFNIAHKFTRILFSVGEAMLVSRGLTCICGCVFVHRGEHESGCPVCGWVSTCECVPGKRHALWRANSPVNRHETCLNFIHSSYIRTITCIHLNTFLCPYIYAWKYQWLQKD